MSNPSDFVIENGGLIKYVGPGGDVLIPDGVTKIGDGAFDGCDSLSSEKHRVVGVPRLPKPEERADPGKCYEYWQRGLLGLHRADECVDPR